MITSTTQHRHRVALVASTVALITGCQPGLEPADLFHPLEAPTGEVDLRQPPPPDDPGHPRLEHRLWRLLRTDRRRGAAAALRQAAQHDIRVAPDGTVELQLELVPGVLAEQLTDRALAVYGGRGLVRGTSHMEAAIPLGRLQDAAAGLHDVAWISALAAPPADVGPALTQGVARTGADRFHCRGVKGQGVHVAVIDTGYGSWSKAVAAGELPNLSGALLPPSSSYHGTSCAEVVADMAPRAVIHPLLTGSLSKMQKWVKDDLPSSKIKVISRSLSSLGGGFGDGKGAWCALAKQVTAQGVAWINSAGNYGGGNFYRGTFKDLDGDGWHEFGTGSSELNKFSFKSTSAITIQLDWDDYPASAQDYNLFIYRYNGSKWATYASSKNKQTGTQPPREYLKLTKPPGGDYAMAIFSNKASKGGMTLRAFKYSGGTTFQYKQSRGSINTVAACEDVIAVAAISQANYATGPQLSYSSQGPSWDGRPKPDVAAPSLVITSPKSKFGGTSAAAPHVAGAVALYIEATGKDAVAAARALVQDATPMGAPVPNSIYGKGRLTLDAKRAGWACTPGAAGQCTTACGSAGTRSCDQGCAWGTCKPPAETCNGKDDDCDGKPDNGFKCIAGASRGCSTTCNTPGKQTCGASCAWSSCQATQAETCNGKDDDCDGQTDEGGVCNRPPDGGAGQAGGDEEGGCSCDVHTGGAGPMIPLLGLLLLFGCVLRTRK